MPMLIRVSLTLYLLLALFASHAQTTAVSAFGRILNQASIAVDLQHITPENRPEITLGLQALPWRWDTHFPKERGIARFTLGFDLTVSELHTAAKNSEGLGFMGTQMGNRYRWKVNDGDWRSVGWDERHTQYRSKPRWHALPHGVLRTGTNVLVLELKMEPANDAGLSAIEVKDATASFQDFQDTLNFRKSSALLVSFSSLLIGVLSLVMWHITRERLFALTCLAELAFALRQSAFFVDYPPVPTWLWNGFFASLFALYVGWVAQTSSELIATKSRSMDRLLQWYLYLSVPVLMTGFALGDHRVYRLWLGVMTALTVVLVLRVSWFAVKTPDLNVRLYAVAAWFALVLGVYDFLLVQINPAGLGKVRLSTYTTFLFNFFLAIVVIRMFLRNRQELIEIRLSAQSARHHAALAERQRIMSDIHDTVGSQLIGMLGMIRSGASHTQLELETTQTLDCLRNAIDAIQPVNGSLVVVLATLRSRVEPHLEAHGLRLNWQLDDLPRMDKLSPQVIQHLQRIVLEVLTNVIKHAQATTVTLKAQASGDRFGAVIEISDDGVGFSLHALAQRVNGLNNIQARANAIGASVVFRNQAPRGACVVLEFAADAVPGHNP